MKWKINLRSYQNKIINNYLKNGLLVITTDSYQVYFLLGSQNR